MTGDGQQVAIPSGETETAHVTNTYDFAPGSLIVTKTIAGPAAGQQEEITIHTECGGKALTPDFVIDPRTPAGDRSKRYDDIPAPTTCKVTETADGHTSAVSVAVEGSGQTVHVGAGEIVDADISDTYGLRPGQLEVTKTIAGPAAGSQGQVVIHTVCNGAALPDFVIAAGTPAGNQSQIYSDIPTPADCVVTETADGQTSTCRSTSLVARRRPPLSRAAAPEPPTSATPTASPSARCSYARRSRVQARVSKGRYDPTECNGTALNRIL